MAHFRATIQGQRGLVSRLGSKKSGIVATVDGWHRGVRIKAGHVNGQDVFTVTLTGGSDGAEPSRQIYPPPVSLDVSAMLAALRAAAELVITARAYFPKAIQNRDRFQLENACATIGRAIHDAEAKGEGE